MNLISSTKRILLTSATVALGLMIPVGSSGHAATSLPCAYAPNIVDRPPHGDRFGSPAFRRDFLPKPVMAHRISAFGHANSSTVLGDCFVPYRSVDVEVTGDAPGADTSHWTVSTDGHGKFSLEVICSRGNDTESVVAVDTVTGERSNRSSFDCLDVR